MKKKILIIAGSILLATVIFNFLAQAYTIPEELRPENAPLEDIGQQVQEQGAGGAAIIVLQIIAGGLLYFAAPVAIIMIGMAAFNIVTGGADTEKIEQGKKHLTWSIIGLIIIILSYSAVRFVISFAFKAGEPERAADVEPYTGEWETPPETPE